LLESCVFYDHSVGGTFVGGIFWNFFLMDVCLFFSFLSIC